MRNRETDFTKGSFSAKLVYDLLGIPSIWFTAKIVSQVTEITDPITAVKTVSLFHWPVEKSGQSIRRRNRSPMSIESNEGYDDDARIRNDEFEGWGREVYDRDDDRRRVCDPRQESAAGRFRSK